MQAGSRGQQGRVREEHGTQRRGHEQTPSGPLQGEAPHLRPVGFRSPITVSGDTFS